MPQLSNRDRRFRAPFELVSGTERYVDGEYLYTDFLYDDGETTYPDNFERYGGNAGDLLEWRISTRGRGLAVRLSLTTLLERDSTIAVVAFDRDDDPATGSSTLPRDPGLPFPGTDSVLTTWGTGAEWSEWNGTEWTSTPLSSSVDLAANQITLTVPRHVARPTGKWRATLATGLYDPDTGGWLPAQKVGGSAIVNLGFRFDVTFDNADPTTGQMLALTTRAPTTYSHVIDFDLLRSRRAFDTVPDHGYMVRMFASRLRSATFTREPTPGEYEEESAREGKFMGPVGSQYLSPVQPYSVYVPTTYRRDRAVPLTLALHGQDAHYWWTAGTQWLARLGEERGSIVLAPSGRGPRGFYMDDSEYDVFEAWNDVANHYRLDRRRTASFGLSMGGYGAYRIGLRYPHLFSRIVSYIPAMQRTQLPGIGNTGIAIPGLNANETYVNQWVDNARNVPVFHLADTLSESTFSPTQYLHAAGPEVAGHHSLESLGYRYLFWAVAFDHVIGIAQTDYPEVRDFLAQHTIEPRPFHVTYVRPPGNDRADLGLAPDRAYWVSEIESRDDAARAHVDAVSSGFGLADPTSSTSQGAGVTAGGIPYVSQERRWADPLEVAPDNRIVIHATNVRSLSIDPRAARVDCDADVEITSDGPVVVELRGCGRRIVKR